MRPIVGIAHKSEGTVHAQMACPLTIMTFFYDFPPQVVICRNIDALALCEDQAIFFPKSTCLALLNKLDDSLGKCVVLEPIFNAVSKVALRLTYVSKFTLVTQSISYQICTPRVVLHDIIKLC